MLSEEHKEWVVKLVLDHLEFCHRDIDYWENESVSDDFIKQYKISRQKIEIDKCQIVLRALESEWGGNVALGILENLASIKSKKLNSA